ncbi:hypothetical protein EV126DRAFT_426026 [Verticillium dahliae]|nr:hypothetical protein EV126DRAFT_426026 [Verticillium dahliae]
MQARACQDNAHHQGKPILGQFSGTSPPCTIAPSHLRPTGLCIIIGWSTQTIVAVHVLALDQACRDMTSQMAFPTLSTS